MNRDAWGALKKSLFFSSEDVAFLFGVTRASAQVFCSRQVKNGAFIRLKKDCYFEFTKIGPFFMAQKEKAFLDACHLSAHGHYAFDAAALDMDRLDRAETEALMAPFPERTRSKVKDIWG